MNPSIPEEALQQVRDALYRGRKIAAIKLYREATHAGLAEAKLAVEQLEAELRAQSPERFAVPAQARVPSGIGCAIMVMAVAIVVLGVMRLMEGRNADQATDLRYSLAFSVVISLCITLQACALSFDPRRRKLACFLLGIGLLLMGVSVRRILHP